MLKRTLYLESPSLLKIKDRQLVLTSTVTGEVRQAPLEDVGFIIADNPEITFNAYLFRACAEHNITLVFCDEKHLPVSMVTTLAANQLVTENAAAQVHASLPLRKNLWMQVVKAKIRNQGAHLKQQGKRWEPLEQMAKTVKSGDTGNTEARAARYYWQELFGGEFRRNPEGGMPNAALNYGYAIIRGAVARAISGSGLLTMLGIFHKNRYNPYALADDLMEPLRPYADRAVLALPPRETEEERLSKDERLALVQLLTVDIALEGETSPLAVGISRVTASLAACYKKEAEKLVLPGFL